MLCVVPAMVDELSLTALPRVGVGSVVLVLVRITDTVSVIPPGASLGQHARTLIAGGAPASAAHHVFLLSVC